ncbi:DNA cytosine methyltransferase [Sulfuriferula nivalis]|uniref:DNA (cytosine-5-)-methyltransferase n=1 Tax=Sulfuriferula nivalis TaxID=2675298 RepID=A0A809RRT8_9PROT|nr:DNA cytosine methyltransferase [Sulfuriferula nivalis]BBP01591.1 cytosine-specific methyltransferase [Sulfuriferula nivalis]
MATIEAVDLFCGAGGLTRGLEDAGVRVRAGFDIDPDCEFPYNANNSATFVLKSVTDLKAADITPWFTPGAVRLLAGCAPCQPFSTMANNSIKRDETKWGMLGEFARLVREIQPELVTMENVPRVTNHAPYQQFISTLLELGYKVDARSLRCTDLGIPQDRRRFVLVASRLGDIYLHTEAGPLPTVREAIGSLPKLAAGETDPNDSMHKARALSEINLERIRASLPGGTWHDWPQHLLSPCHKAESGASYKSVYSRMVWGKPAPTITTQCCSFGTGRFGHPEQDRGISLREAAILQSFPVSYCFVPEGEPISINSVARMIGNAVPPKLGFAVGKTLLKHLEKHYA